MASKRPSKPVSKAAKPNAKNFAPANSHQVQSWHLLQAGKKRRLANQEPPPEEP